MQCAYDILTQLQVLLVLVLDGFDQPIQAVPRMITAASRIELRFLGMLRIEPELLGEKREL